MQTFLPYPDFMESSRVLDTRRLGKQRVEAVQLIRSLNGETKGWANHPARVMWRGFIPALMEYHDTMIEEWIRRGFRNTMPIFDVIAEAYPPFIGDEAFHSSHRSNLLRKDPVFYEAFGWTDDPNAPYIWPGEQK